MPYGSTVGVLVFGTLVALTLVAPRRPRVLGRLGYRVASVYNEAPFPFIYLIVGFSILAVASEQRESPARWIVFGLELLVVLVSWSSRGVVRWSGPSSSEPSTMGSDPAGVTPPVLASSTAFGSERRSGGYSSCRSCFGRSALGGRATSRMATPVASICWMSTTIGRNPRERPCSCTSMAAATTAAARASQGERSSFAWRVGAGSRSAPTTLGVLGHPADDAPPFFIAHGAEDSLATIDTSRRFVAHLRAASPNPVVFAELPHGQHAFDLFHSFRFSAVVDGIEAFTAWVRTQVSQDSTGPRRSADRNERASVP
jgi:hypothetical protein